MRVLRPNSVSRGCTDRQFDFTPQSPQPSHTASLMTTRVRRTGSAPRLRNRRDSAAQRWSYTSTVTPSPDNPLGTKGVGEAGTIGAAPAIANAVMDALKPLGIRHLDMPFLPEKVWQAIQAAGGQGA